MEFRELDLRLHKIASSMLEDHTEARIRGLDFLRVFDERQPGKRAASRMGMTEIVSPSSFLSEDSELQMLREILRSTPRASEASGLKFSGGCIALLPADTLRPYVAAAHEHGLYVTSSGWGEHLLRAGRPSSIQSFVKVCKDVGFDVVELSHGSTAALGEPELVHLIRAVKRAGMASRPEIDILDTDAGVGNLRPYQLASEGPMDPVSIIEQAERWIQAGADAVLVSADGIDEDAASWRTDIVVQIVERLGLERTIFEAAHPGFAEWLVRSFGPEVNISIAHNRVPPLRRWRDNARSNREKPRRFT